MLTLLYKPVATVSHNNNGEPVYVNNLFEVSQEFEREFKDRTGFGVDDPQAGNLRTNEIAVDIFRQKGAEWSGPGLASIEIPEMLVGYVKVLAFKEGERLYYDYNKLMFDKVAVYAGALERLTAFLSELRAVMRMFPNTVTMENRLMKRIEIRDRFNEQEYSYKGDIYVDFMLQTRSS
jgi:hypothetical protein